jgi:urease accessory protein
VNRPMHADESVQVFAANRAVGRVELAVEARSGAKTRRARVREEGSLRVRFPGPASGALEAVLVNTGGGMAGGDRFALEVAAGEATRLVLGTAAAEKVYRTLGPDATVDVKLDVGAGATLAWLPQETIMFDGARLTRRIEVDLATTAQLVLAEAVVFGRAGMGEAVEHGRLLDRWQVRRAGKLIHAENVKLDGAISEKLAQTASANGGVAVATVLIVPGDDAMVEAIRALGAHFRGEVGVSAWNGRALVRLCAADGAMLRHDLVRVVATLRVAPLPRLWIN